MGTELPFGGDENALELDKGGCCMTLGVRMPLG